MELSDLLATVPASTATIVDAATVGGLDAAVPSCPGWDLRALARHIGNVHRWATRLVVAGSVELQKREEAAPLDDELLPWLSEGATRLVVELGRRGPTAPAWTFAPGDATAGFWFRRMAHETAMHAHDAGSAVGRAEPLAAELASDGIDELLTVMVPRRRPEGLRGTLHVHCTDVAGEWVLDLSTLTTRREHAKGDAALRGPASDLLLRLANRGQGGEVLGDAGVLEAFRTNVRY